MENERWALYLGPEDGTELYPSYWLSEVLVAYNLSKLETFLRMAALIDQFSETFAITSDTDIQNYQLACAFTAVKREEDWRKIPFTFNWCQLSLNGFSKEDLICFEARILNCVQFKIETVHSFSLLNLLTLLTETQNKRMGNINKVKFKALTDLKKLIVSYLDKLDNFSR